MSHTYDDLQRGYGDQENRKPDHHDDLEGYDYTRDPDAFDPPVGDYYEFPDDELRRRRSLLDDDEYPLPHETPRGVWDDEEDDEEFDLRRVG